jgi:tryptophan synthase alpha chain
MNRIQELFSKKRNIFSVYFTAGFPELNDAALIMEELQNAGVDMIEIGIPFSDPLADGPVIQQSNEIALKNGMSLKLLFDQLEDFNKINNNSTMLKFLMGYYNPIMQFGINEFCKRTKACGVDGVIIPDLPLNEYIENHKILFKEFKLENILLITPNTAEERIRMIDEHSQGFIYLVSSAGTTGVRYGISNEQEKYFHRIKEMKLKNPLMIGFGISDNNSFMKACEHANGAIIGSAFINRISKSKDLRSDIRNFINGIRY